MNKSESKYFNTSVKMDLALISLLKKKTFEYITVSEICKTAGVNRSTFYLHYETIGDLLDETARYLIDDFLMHFTDDAETSILKLKDLKVEQLVFISEKYLIPYLTYIKDRKNIFCAVLQNYKIFGFEDVYKRMFECIFNPILNKFDYPENIRQYVMMYYLNGINAITVEWLKNGCDKSVKEISEIISVCIYGYKNANG